MKSSKWTRSPTLSRDALPRFISLSSSDGGPHQGLMGTTSSVRQIVNTISWPASSILPGISEMKILTDRCTQQICEWSDLNPPPSQFSGASRGNGNEWVTCVLRVFICKVYAWAQLLANERVSRTGVKNVEMAIMTVFVRVWPTIEAFRTVGKH